MSFADQLARLRDASAYGTRGVPELETRVRREDLRALIRNFDRVDEELRAMVTRKLDERRNKLSDIERSLLIDLAEKPMTRQNFDALIDVDRIAIMSLIGLDLVEFRRSWWIFGPFGYTLTRKGRIWAESLGGWGEG